MKNNPDQYKGLVRVKYVEDIDFYSKYVAEMRKPTTWGDDVTLQAFADLYERDLNVVTCQHTPNAFVRWTSTGSDGLDIATHHPPMYLACYADVYYSAVIEIHKKPEEVFVHTPIWGEPSSEANFRRKIIARAMEPPLSKWEKEIVTKITKLGFAKVPAISRLIIALLKKHAKPHDSLTVSKKHAKQHYLLTISKLLEHKINRKRILVR